MAKQEKKVEEKVEVKVEEPKVVEQESNIINKTGNIKITEA